MRIRSISVGLTVLAVALTSTACSEAPPVSDDVGFVTTSPAQKVVRRAVSTVTGEMVVRRQPSLKGEVLTRLPEKTPLGSPRVFAVEDATKGWVQVALPIRPNGITGWVSAQDVRLERVTSEITVDLVTRRLEYLVDGKTVTATRVGIGSTKNPTPTGRFFVTDRVRPPSPDGAYGVFALGLSAHSDSLSEFGNGDGQVGIHGTNQPSSIGRAVSHGCIRVPNKVAQLLEQVPLGTPVVIE